MRRQYRSVRYSAGSKTEIKQKESRGKEIVQRLEGGNRQRHIEAPQQGKKKPKITNEEKY